MIIEKKNNFFPIFSINNFLNEEECNILSSNFPKIKSEDLNNNDNGKYSFDSKSEILLDLIKKNENLRELLENIKKRIIKIIFLNKIFFLIFKERKFSIKLLVKFLLHILKIKKYFEFNFQFSYIYNHGYITPHLDGRKKLISLMLYFPDNLPNKDLNKKQQEIGTCFYFNSRMIEGSNIHLKNENEIKTLEETSEFYQTPFVAKHLYGFIRNERSWHSVKRLNIKDNYVRKSLNININLI